MGSTAIEGEGVTERLSPRHRPKLEEPGKECRCSVAMKTRLLCLKQPSKKLARSPLLHRQGDQKGLEIIRQYRGVAKVLI